jgi:hypothetical protein
MQMGVGERQGIASGRYPAPPTVDAAGRALHMHDLTPRTKDNLVVEETMIYCGNRQASNPMTTFHSGVDTVKMTGRHYESVGHLMLGADRVSSYWLNGNSVELSFQKAGHLKRRKNRRRNTMTQALWGTRAMNPGMGGSSYYWMRGKACVGWTCCSNGEQDRWSWVGLN